MKTLIGTVLWTDNRTKGREEGQIRVENGPKLYFNQSTVYNIKTHGMPSTGQLVRFELDIDGFPRNVRDFLCKPKELELT